MSYYYRENPKLSDRLRHKSGNDLLQKIKQQFDEDNNTFFEPRPARNNFERHAEFPRGFPFDEDKELGRRNDIRSHLDELAARHPEFADHLLGSPWDIPFQGPLRNRRQSNQTYPDEDTRSQASGSSAASGASAASSHGESEPVNGHETRTPRSTFEARQMEMDPQRNQRSMSAPPENRQQTPNPNRYVSKVEITPQQQQQQQKEKSPTPQPQSIVRHIPIFVEGRDTPVLPKNPEPEPAAFQRQQSPPTFKRPSAFSQGIGARSHRQWPPEFQDTFFNRDRDQFDGPRWSSGHAQPHQTFPSQQQQFRQHPNEKPRGFHQEPPHPQQHYPPHQQPQQQTQSPPQPEPQEPLKPKQPPLPKDPLERVALVQQEVDSLTEQVKQFSGTSRQDKQYIFLDEMLTRELIKLDDIETEGKENVRLARKNAIKSIQESISLLESKVPLPQEQQQEVETEVEEDQKRTEECVPDETMEAESHSQEADASQPNAIPLPPCTPAPAEVPTEKQEEQPVTTDEKNEVPVLMDDQTEKAGPEMPMEVQVNAEEIVTVEPAAVPCEEKVDEAESVKQEPSETPVETEQPAEKPTNVEEVSQETQEMEVCPMKSPKKLKKTKKSTPISEQAIPLPPPEPKN